jgi:hypothetical protein
MDAERPLPILAGDRLGLTGAGRERPVSGEEQTVVLAEAISQNSANFCL